MALAVIGGVLATLPPSALMPAGVGAAPPVPPADRVPPVAPVELAPIAPADARAANALVPFAAPDGVMAPAFRFIGSAADQLRARDCLAAAVLYEAGDDAIGQRAVAQVVLNRARHPAFPGTVCGVVFQGSERRTGCQFTFTCDGALARRTTDAAWARAQAVAEQALGGLVFGQVGLATHYHTDWVRPYWSDSLTKITAVDTHLFFRWPGYWGTTAALRAGGGRDEPVVAKLAALSVHHGALVTVPDDVGNLANAAPSLPPLSDTRIAQAPTVDGARETILLALDPRSPADGYAGLALQLCGERPYCKLMGWTNAGLKPGSEAMSGEQRAAMSFSYLRDRTTGFERMLWNCSQSPRANPRDCMKR